MCKTTSFSSLNSLDENDLVLFMVTRLEQENKGEERKESKLVLRKSFQKQDRKGKFLRLFSKRTIQENESL